MLMVLAYIYFNTEYFNKIVFVFHISLFFILRDVINLYLHKKGILNGTWNKKGLVTIVHNYGSV